MQLEQAMLCTLRPKFSFSVFPELHSRCGIRNKIFFLSDKLFRIVYLGDSIAALDEISKSRIFTRVVRFLEDILFIWNVYFLSIGS